MFKIDLVNQYNINIFKTSLYINIVQDEKCRLMRNLSLSMVFMLLSLVKIKIENRIHCIDIYNGD